MTPTRRPPRRRSGAAARRRRRNRRLVVAAPVVVVGALVLRVLGFPATDAPAPADAVVVMADSGDEGLHDGLALVNDGLAPALVVVRVSPDDGGPLCAEGGTVEVGGAGAAPTGAVLCTDALAGERDRVRAVAGLVADRSWRTVVLVQRRPALSATAARLGRCTGAVVLRRAVAVPAGTGVVGAAAGRLPDTLRALLVEKTC